MGRNTRQAAQCYQMACRENSRIHAWNSSLPYNRQSWYVLITKSAHFLQEHQTFWRSKRFRNESSVISKVDNNNIIHYCSDIKRLTISSILWSFLHFRSIKALKNLTTEIGHFNKIRAQVVFQRLSQPISILLQDHKFKNCIKCLFSHGDLLLVGKKSKLKLSMMPVIILNWYARAFEFLPGILIMALGTTGTIYWIRTNQNSEGCKTL